MEIHTQYDQYIEVHKYYAGTIFGVAILALALEALLPVYFRSAAILELPLLVTVYFGLSRRNPSSGLLLGMAIGLAQDSLGHTPFGMYGIAKTAVGFVASSFGSRIDVEHPISRFLLTFVFFHLHNGVLVVINRLLLGQHEPYLETKLVIASIVNSAVAVVFFAVLDKFRKP
ncbi:MAG: rod shape-determining protein MreD [Acidobacteria bacterium]|nr:MAG: rod shape-determining protein MreD [Acidobacteriota bacterium]